MARLCSGLYWRSQRRCGAAMKAVGLFARAPVEVVESTDFRRVGARCARSAVSVWTAATVAAVVAAIAAVVATAHDDDSAAARDRVTARRVRVGPARRVVRAPARGVGAWRGCRHDAIRRGRRSPAAAAGGSSSRGRARGATRGAALEEAAAARCRHDDGLVRPQIFVDFRHAGGLDRPLRRALRCVHLARELRVPRHGVGQRGSFIIEASA